MLTSGTLRKPRRPGYFAVSQKSATDVGVPFTFSVL